MGDYTDGWEKIRGTCSSQGTNIPKCPIASNAQSSCRHPWLTSPAQTSRKFLISPTLCFGFSQWDAYVGTWENGWSKSTLKTCDFSGNNEWRWIMKTLPFPRGWWSSGWGFLWSWEARGFLPHNPWVSKESGSIQRWPQWEPKGCSQKVIQNSGDGLGRSGYSKRDYSDERFSYIWFVPISSISYSFPGTSPGEY